MKKEKAKKISKYITLLFMYFGSKMIFEELFEFNEFDKLAFKGYAYKGREKFINELPKEQIIQIQNFVQKIMNKKVDKETLDFLIDYLYIYSLSNEKKEFEALHEYYDGNSSKIEDFQEKITTELFQSHNLDKKLLKNFNSEKFILESIEDSDPNNALGKVFRVGIKNKFFNKEDHIEFYEEQMKKFA